MIILYATVLCIFLKSTLKMSHMPLCCVFFEVDFENVSQATVLLLLLLLF